MRNGRIFRKGEGKKKQQDLSSSLRLLMSSSSSRWRQVPSDLIFSKCRFTSSRHSAWQENILFKTFKLSFFCSSSSSSYSLTAAEAELHEWWEIQTLLIDSSNLCSFPAHFGSSIPLVCTFITCFTFKIKLAQNQGWNRTWDLKYVSCGVDSTSADAMSKWRRIWRKDGLFLGLQFLQIHKRCSCDHSENSEASTLKHLPSTWVFCSRLHAFYLRLSRARVSLPALSEEDLEAVGAALRYRQLEAVVPHTPDDGRRVHVFIRDLSCQHLPQHHSEGPSSKSEVLFIQDVWMRSWYV